MDANRCVYKAPIGAHLMSCFQTFQQQLLLSVPFSFDFASGYALELASYNARLVQCSPRAMPASPQTRRFLQVDLWNSGTHSLPPIFIFLACCILTHSLTLLQAAFYVGPTARFNGRLFAAASPWPSPHGAQFCLWPVNINQIAPSLVLLSVLLSPSCSCV